MLHVESNALSILTLMTTNQLCVFQGTTTVSSVAILFLLASPLTLPGRANLAVKCLLGVSAAQVRHLVLSHLLWN